MRQVKLIGGPFDGQVLKSQKPVFELQLKFEPEDESATVDINDLDVLVYRDADADEHEDILTWCENPSNPFALFP